MTPVTTTMPTPYHAQIQRMEDQRYPSAQQKEILSHLKSLQEGYRKAKAEDAALLEALKKAYVAIINHHADGERIAGQRCEFCQGELATIEKAIAQATGKE